jgi:hypothetical protein
MCPDKERGIRSYRPDLKLNLSERRLTFIRT